jgi:hypothetical protein
MGWSVGYDDSRDRDIGYGVPAECESPKCRKKIDRGLSYACGSGYSDVGCGLYFCDEHRSHWYRGFTCCTRCANRRPPYEAKPDLAVWTRHKLEDPSWEQWRNENAVTVTLLKRALELENENGTGQDQSR